MSKVNVRKTYFNGVWLINKEYCEWIKSATTVNQLSTATGVAKKSCSRIWVREQ